MEFWFELKGEYHFFVDGFEAIVEAENYFQAALKLAADLNGYLDNEASSV